MEHDCRCNAFYKALTTTYENHTESQDILSELRLQDLEHRNLDYPVLDSSHKTCASCARNVNEILECTLFGHWAVEELLLELHPEHSLDIASEQ